MVEDISISQDLLYMCVVLSSQTVNILFLDDYFICYPQHLFASYVKESELTESLQTKDSTEDDLVKGGEKITFATRQVRSSQTSRYWNTKLAFLKDQLDHSNHEGEKQHWYEKVDLQPKLHVSKPPDGSQATQQTKKKLTGFKTQKCELKQLTRPYYRPLVRDTDVEGMAIKAHSFSGTNLNVWYHSDSDMHRQPVDIVSVTKLGTNQTQFHRWVYSSVCCISGYIILCVAQVGISFCLLHRWVYSVCCTGGHIILFVAQVGIFCLLHRWVYHSVCCTGGYILLFVA